MTRMWCIGTRQMFINSVHEDGASFRTTDVVKNC